MLDILQNISKKGLAFFIDSINQYPKKITHIFTPALLNLNKNALITVAFLFISSNMFNTTYKFTEKYISKKISKKDKQWFKKLLKRNKNHNKKVKGGYNIPYEPLTVIMILVLLKELLGNNPSKKLSKGYLTSKITKYVKKIQMKGGYHVVNQTQYGCKNAGVLLNDYCI